ncbi:hypothetical protein H0R92_01700 [Treponema sp. OMZ 840]|uniref:hypothetical protein n=1 Tax=Treponema sp. OMZ 840 TaxID=244313 RepID=UPI003D8C0E41
MKNRILRKIRTAALFFVKLMLVAAVCFIFACIFVYPLWLFAVQKPNMFSITVLIFFALFISIFFAAKIRSRKKHEKD